MRASEEEREDLEELFRSMAKRGRQANLSFFAFTATPNQDSDLERLYVFLRHLALKLPRRHTGLGYQFDDEVRLEYYRLQKISEGSIRLQVGQAVPISGPAEVGSGLASPWSPRSPTGPTASSRRQSGALGKASRCWPSSVAPRIPKRASATP
jgi:type I restriction enzyme R subunit